MNCFIFSKILKSSLGNRNKHVYGIAYKPIYTSVTRIRHEFKVIDNYREKCVTDV